MDGDPTGVSDNEAEYAPWKRWPVATAQARVELIASALGVTLARALPSDGLLDVRVVPWRRWWVVRLEAGTPGAQCLADLLGGQPGGDNDTWPWRESMEFTGEWGFEDPDPGLWAPGWYAVRPGVEYGREYERALAAMAELDRVMRPVLLAGAMDFDADNWIDGRGVVRVTLNPDDASKLDARVDSALEYSRGGFAA